MTRRRAVQRRVITVIALVIAVASKVWIEALDRSECGRYSSLVDARLSNSLVLASHASAIALLVLAASSRQWEGVPRARLFRWLTGLGGVAIGIAGVLSWAQMNYRCHGS